MSITGSNNPFPCHPVVFSAGNSIISLGTITRVGNVFTFSVGFVWEINGVTYQNTAPIDLTIEDAPTGYFRIDNALLNTSNTIELQQGLPSETIALRPTYPETNILLTSWNISGNVIDDSETPLLGTDVVKKSFSSTSEYNGVGSNVIIPFNPNGYSEIRLINSGLVSISGFDLSLMTGPNAEFPYQGKEIMIWNRTGGNVTLNHEDFATADYPMFLRAETDLVLPDNHILTFKYDAGGLQEKDKSFFSVDEIIGLASVLASKANLVAGKIPASELPSYVDDVLEFANLAAFPATGETGKIYLALDTNFTYRWSGSVYLKISDTGKLDKVTSSGVERAYIINADGTQSTKPTSDFGTVKGTGTTNRISKFTAGGTIGDSQIFDDGTNVGIGTTTPQARLDVRAQGALSTDIAFRVRNSTDTTDLLSLNGLGVTTINAENENVQLRLTNTGQVNNRSAIAFQFNNSGVDQAMIRALPGIIVGSLGRFAISTYNAFGGGMVDRMLFDEFGGVSIGAFYAHNVAIPARLDVRAQGALSTDIAFRIRNSTDTQNFLVVNGAGDVYNNGAGGVNSNTFFGENVGRNATGNSNTAIGQSALLANTTGTSNTAIGVAALQNNTTGNSNAAIGVAALRANTTGSNNTAIGQSALLANTTGKSNTAIGQSSLLANTTGNYNAAIGVSALQNNTTGSNNTAIGVEAGKLISNGSNNTTSNNSIFLGSNTAPLANNQTNQIVIGNGAIGLGSNSVVLGDKSITITQLRGQVIMGAFASPPTGIEGAIYYDSTTKKHRGFNGTAWNDLY